MPNWPTQIPSSITGPIIAAAHAPSTEMQARIMEAHGYYGGPRSHGKVLDSGDARVARSYSRSMSPLLPPRFRAKRRLPIRMSF